MQQKMELPLEIYAAIALQSVQTWREMLAVCDFGRWSTSEAGKKATEEFVVRTETSNYIVFQRNGKLHSARDLPAFLGKTRFGYHAIWMKDGLLHRVGAPAFFVEHTVAWGEDGWLHREDSRAVWGIPMVHRWYTRGEIQRCETLLGDTFLAKTYDEKGYTYRYSDGYERRGEETIKFNPIKEGSPGKTYTSFSSFGKKALSRTFYRSEIPLTRIDTSGPIIIHVRDKSLHNDNGAAVVGKSQNDQFEVWAFAGILHRVGGPAITTKTYEAWMRDGAFHRVGGPAETETTLDGTLRQKWYMWGRLHRVDGPAIIETLSCGKIVCQYYRRGEKKNSVKSQLVESAVEEMKSECAKETLYAPKRMWNEICAEFAKTTRDFPDCCKTLLSLQNVWPES